METHIDKEIDIQKDIWLEAVKIYGNKPKKLFIRIKINNLKNMIKFDKLLFIIILNSFKRNLKRMFHNMIYREGINQYWNGKNKKIKNMLNQFNDIFILVHGSKIENKLVIIFTLI